MIRVLLCYARSGGTLFSKFIAAQKNVIFLSEVNPNLNAVTSPAQQVKKWYNIRINQKLSFERQIEEIQSYCLENSLTLIIRDFSFIDFTPHELNNHQPKNKFSILKSLEGIGPVKPLAFVRNAIDVWISRGCPPKFSEGYLLFSECIVRGKIPFLKYEDFCNNPENVLMEASKSWEHEPFIYEARFIQYNKVTGDNLMDFGSRGKGENSIKSFNRKPIPPTLFNKLKKDELLHKSNLLLGYQQKVDSQDIGLGKALFMETKQQAKKLLGRYPADKF
jgi:hypothetical protein